MAFINLSEAAPQEEGVYRVIVDSMDDKGYETRAKWSKEEGFQLIDGQLEDDAFIDFWWLEDSIQ